ASEGSNGLNHGECHLPRWHFALGQALAELCAQPGEGLPVIRCGIGEGAVDIRKRYPSPWECRTRERGYRLARVGGAFQAIEVVAPQQRSRIAQRDERCPGRDFRVQRLGVEFQDVLRMAAGELEECQVPGQMAVDLRLAWETRQPAPQKLRA